MVLQTIQGFADQVISFFNVFGPVVGYSPQYFEMQRQRSVGSFSKFICIIMIIAHSLRLQFYILKPYHISLFLQSFLMLFIQSALLYKFFQISEYESKIAEASSGFPSKTEEEVSMLRQNASEKEGSTISDSPITAKSPNASFLSDDSFRLEHMPTPSQSGHPTTADTMEMGSTANRPKSDMSASHKRGSFGARQVDNASIRGRDVSGPQDKQEHLIQKTRSRPIEYVPRFRLVFVNTLGKLGLTLGTYLLLFVSVNKIWFAEWTALVSVSCEALLPIVQFNANFQKKSVHSLSLSMIMCWFVGDVVKLYFLLRKEQPLQFILSTLTIITFDVLILLQFKLYGKKQKQ